MKDFHKNSFVDYLDQFNVLSPNHSKIYDEYTYDKGKDSYTFTIETRVESYLREIFASNPQSVILTGNAGDGKTRLCRSVYNFFDEQGLVDWPESGIIEVEFQHGKIRMVKDLSELTEDIILTELRSLQNNIVNNHEHKVYYLIAANEGKLTKFLSQNNELTYLREAVKQRFKSHESNDGTFSIINLLDVTSSLYVEKVLDEWNKESNWSVCDACPKQKACIINLNHQRSSQKVVRDRLVEQYRFLDYLGSHITMREMLIHISYLLTGGLTCKDVLDANYEELKVQLDKPYYENFYGHNVEHEAFSDMRAIKLFRELDPGKYSDSSIDDFIVNGDISGSEELEALHEGMFDDSLDLYLGYFKKRLDIYRNHNKDSNDTLIEDWIEKLRRKFYFEFPSEEFFNRKNLIPFKFVGDFDELFGDPRKQGSVRADLMTGINRAFSKKLVDSKVPLVATSENLMIHSTIVSGQIRLLEENERKDIDHRSSKLFFVIRRMGKDAKLPLNLYVFEYLMRLSSGDTHNILREDVEILLDTFRNELIKGTEPDPYAYTLDILRLDKDKGLYVQDDIQILS
ncbi:ATP-binding protein [Priestia endophytica]|uniref:ATP-binding protein n=1 Tax=Priestia endophytica TaxID=135735 RepID=UPI002E1F9064|nr:ATP-binding protein [Priestia endophytica]